MSNSVFTSNAGISGGALFASAGYVKLDTVTFTSNQAVKGGGLAYLHWSEVTGALIILNCNFSSNQGTNTGALYMDVSAVENNMTFDIQGTTFDSNTASFGSIIGTE